jgi:hypothetical protein
MARPIGSRIGFIPHPTSEDLTDGSCSCVFNTIGPYQATGSSIGFPDAAPRRGFI